VRWEGTGRAWVGWVGGRTDRVSERRHGQPRHGHVVHRVQLIELVLRTAPPHTLTPSMPLKPGLSASGNPIVLSSRCLIGWAGWVKGAVMVWICLCLTTPPSYDCLAAARVRSDRDLRARLREAAMDVD
jgi:hypothetical protein